MRFRAFGPSLAGCHEIPSEVAAGFIARGGEDIQVWDTEYIIDSVSEEAAIYAARELALTDLEEAPEEN